MKIILLFCLVMMSVRVAIASIAVSPGRFVVVDTENNAVIPVAPDNLGSPGTVVFRAAIQSSSVDWEAISVLRLREYRFNFTNTRVAGTGRNGWELYYLDEFPCTGSGQWVRTWLNQTRNLADSTFPVRANCIMQPAVAKFAWRVSQENQWQGRTNGILTCAVDRNMNVSLEACRRQTWAEFQRDGPISEEDL